MNSDLNQLHSKGKAELEYFMASSTLVRSSSDQANTLSSICTLYAMAICLHSDYYLPFDPSHWNACPRTNWESSV